MMNKDVFKNIGYGFLAFIYIICAIDVVGYAIYNHVVECAICGTILGLMALPFTIKCVKKLF